MRSKAVNNQLTLLHCTITKKIMTRNKKTKNLRSTESREEADESVLRKEKRVYSGNDLKKKW